MSNIIDSIRMSGTTYAISDSGGTKVVEITQSDYDNLPTSAKTANIMYVITDAEPFDVSNYYTKAETSGATELATAFAATQPKLSAGTNITIDANNVISASGGGGKAVSGGTNISITTGETADTINCTLPIKTNAWNSLTFNTSRNPSQVLYASAFGDYTTASGKGSFAIGKDTTASGEYSFVGGYNSSQAKGSKSFSFGDGAVTNGIVSVAFGQTVTTNNHYEFSCGKLNKSVSATSSFGDSGNTLFSVGNGTSTYHNAFEVRQNGDIYITSGNTDIKLQDHLGGGGGGIDSGTVQTMIDQSISGKTNQTDFVSHSGNTTIHVTASEKSTWNSKSDFSGNYNDLSNKPTIPSKTSDLTNDSNFATTGDVQTATNDMATKTWVGQQGYLTQHQDISGKQDVSGMTAYTTTATTSALNNVVTAHTANTSIHVSAEQIAAWNAKSDFSGSYNDLTNKLSAGTNVTIVDNVISAEGGGSITIDPSLDTSSTNAVANSAITTAINAVSGAIPTTYVSAIAADTDAGYQRFYRFSTPSNFNYFILRNAKINGRQVLNGGWSSDVNEYSLVETSAITTSVTSSSTDSQVPSAKAVNDKLGGLSIVKLSQSEYDSLATKDNSTLYVIVN